MALEEASVFVGESWESIESIVLVASLMGEEVLPSVFNGEFINGVELIIILHMEFFAFFGLLIIVFLVLVAVLKDVSFEFSCSFGSKMVENALFKGEMKIVDGVLELLSLEFIDNPRELSD